MKSQEEIDAKVVRWARCDPELRRAMIKIVRSAKGTEERAKRDAVTWAWGLYALTLIP